MKKNNRQLLEVLYDCYEQAIYRVAYGVVRQVEQAEDITQETFMQLYQNIERIRSLDEVETKRYILRMAKNKAIDHYRKNQKQVDFLSNYRQTQVTAEDNVETKVSELISDEQLVTLLRILPETYQQVFMYRVYYGLTTREVAELLSLSEVNVRKQYERAKKKIIGLIGGTDHDDIRETLEGIS